MPWKACPNTSARVSPSVPMNSRPDWGSTPVTSTPWESAQLVHEIVQHGDRATQTCKDILGSFAQFLRSRPMTAGEQGGISW